MRSLTTKNLFSIKTEKTIEISHEVLSKAIGHAEAKGIWLIYGAEKNGKTLFTLKLAKALCQNHKVAYISAEEGLDKSFRDAVKRAGLTAADNIHWYPYIDYQELIEKLQKPKSAQVIFIDNIVVYNDVIKPMMIKQLEKNLAGKLIVILGHEERNEPYPATAKMAKKMAKVYVQIKGLKAFVVSRFSKGGNIVIDEEKSTLYWGDEIDNI
jgi:predicted ATP-dependent serine protease